MTDVCFFAALTVQHKDAPLGTSTSAVTLVSTSPASVAIVAASGVGAAATSSPADSDLYIPTASADVAADIAKYTNKVRKCAVVLDLHLHHLLTYNCHMIVLIFCHHLCFFNVLMFSCLSFFRSWTQSKVL